jgi:hypothetical protein
LALDKDAPLSRTAKRAGVFFADQSSADCITNMSGFDFRQAQVFYKSLTDIRLLSPGARTEQSAISARQHAPLAPYKQLCADVHHGPRPKGLGPSNLWRFAEELKR